MIEPIKQGIGVMPNMLSRITPKDRAVFLANATERTKARVAGDTTGKVIMLSRTFQRHKCPDGFCPECDDPRDTSGM